MYSDFFEPRDGRLFPGQFSPWWSMYLGQKSPDHFSSNFLKFKICIQCAAWKYCKLIFYALSEIFPLKIECVGINCPCTFFVNDETKFDFRRIAADRTNASQYRTKNHYHTQYTRLFHVVKKQQFLSVFLNVFCSILLHTSLLYF